MFRRLGYEGLEGRLLLAAIVVNNIVVSNLNDSGAGSLRDAIATANNDSHNSISDTITFGVSGQITLSTGELDVGSGSGGSGAITINGAGAITISGNDSLQVFNVLSTFTGTLSGLTIVHGHSDGYGGGIYNLGTLTVANCVFANNTAVNAGGAIYNGLGAVTVTGSTFTGNTAGEGGAIYTTATMTVDNSTFFNNTGSAGGAIEQQNGSLTVSNSTLSGNTGDYGGGIYISAQTTLVNTIVAQNTAAGAPDVYGAVNAASTDNLIGDGTNLTGITNGTNGNQVGAPGSPIDAKLGALGNYGGSVQTMPLLAGSPAINAGGAVTTLSSAATNSTLSIVVANAAAIARTAGSFLIQIDGEQMLVTAVNVGTNTLTVTRSVNGVVASHNTSAAVFFPLDERGSARVNTVDIGAFEYQELSDASFELFGVGAGAFDYNVGGSPWTFVGSAGIASNASAFTSANPNAPAGTQVAFVQSTGSMAVTVSLASAGNYAISFQAAQRGSGNSGTQTIQVLVDGTVVDSVAPFGAGYLPYTFITTTLTAGNHTITFKGLAATDATSLIDAVSITTATAVSGQFGDQSFETVSVGAGGAAYDPSGSAWKFSGTAGITANNSGFTKSANAPAGSQVAFLQVGGAMSQLVNLASAGSYAISFSAAQRGSGNSGNQTIQVLVDGIVLDTVTPFGAGYLPYTFISTALTAGNHTITFKGLATTDATALIDAVSITAVTASSGQFGDQSFETVSVGAGGAAYDPSGSNWTFSGTAGITANNSGFTKSASAPAGSQVAFLQVGGTMSQVVNLASAGNYAISFQAAQRGSGNTGNQTIQVLVDGTVVDSVTPFGAGYLPYTVITTSLTAGNHTITFKGLATTDATALVDSVSVTLATAVSGQPGDAGFETVSVGAGGAMYDPSGSSWKFSGTAGIAANNSGFTKSANAPAGSQVAFLQVGGTMSQVVNLASAGNYAISFQAAQRGSGNTGNQTIQVLVDGTIVDSVTPFGAGYLPYTVITAALAVGNHTITFKGLATTDATALIDSVNIAAATAASGQPGDASFETVNVGAGGAAYDPSGSSWTFSGTAGIAANNSGFTKSASAPNGSQVAFVQATGSIAQAVNLASAGSFAISFQAAQRGSGNAGNQTIQVLIDGVAVATFVPVGSSYTLYTTAKIALAAGKHTITLKGFAYADSTALLDAVSIA